MTIEEKIEAMLNADKTQTDILKLIIHELANVQKEVAALREERQPSQNS